jgi:high-affinity nickel-transport protein
VTAARLSAREKRTVAAMMLAVAGLHVTGFAELFALNGGVLTIGVGLTPYTLGLRRAFDADHIAAIDTTTRKLMAEGKRPLSVGFWFSLGHATVVFALALLIAAGVRSLGGPVADEHSTLRMAAGGVGAAVSAGVPLRDRRAQHRGPARPRAGVPGDADRNLSIDEAGALVTVAA